MKLFIATCLLASGVNVFAQPGESDGALIARIETQARRSAMEKSAAESRERELRERSLEATAMKALIQFRLHTKGLRVTSVTVNKDTDSTGVQFHSGGSDRSYTMSTPDQKTVCRGRAIAHDEEVQSSSGRDTRLERRSEMQIDCYDSQAGRKLLSERAEDHQVEGRYVGYFHARNPSTGLFEEFRPIFKDKQIVQYSKVEQPTLSQYVSKAVRSVRDSLK